jgi:hypothetical protein
VPRTTEWVCQVPEGDGSTTVVFVSASDRAFDGIDRANQTAGQAFERNFGERCTVE